ncbi:MAG: hypothetical protein KatS3mg003_2389 [Candidatus Nitrosocaldaceae archaeon]|nr:MAG: hypothetical protein KatS3mg003_1328 [Candidatus Nitrosocaldaceae archaeon]GIU72910.1 MAG: hypothetical protein KatS3mg003_2389 [Candidatus Nitrosocaldaceae archaeon]
MDYENESRYSLASSIFEYIAENDIVTIDELTNHLCISKDNTMQVVNLLIRFGLLEYKDTYNITIALSKAARIILD